MDRYDAVIVGGSTTGSFFARKLSEAGFKTLVLEKEPGGKVGAQYDIFHIPENDFERFGLPQPVKGEDWAFRFDGSRACSAFDKNPKELSGAVVGMHKHLYTLRLNRWAMDAGAEFRYGAGFEDFTYDPAGRITGALYSRDGSIESVSARLVADCSGIPSAARVKLPDGYGVENFKLTSDDMFYVILKYVGYPNQSDWVKRLRTWTFFKTWEAPQADPHGAILGVGANGGFEQAERNWSIFEKTVKLPKYELQHTERGTTPYRRPPYSFVADSFIALGDAACHTKPHAGEGVSSSMVMCGIAVDVMKALRGQGKDFTRANLWPINKRYIDQQGGMYASMLATLVGAVATNARENDFFFEKNVIFSKESFEAMNADKPLKFSAAQTAAMAGIMLWGVLTGRLRVSTIKSLLAALGSGGMITKLYDEYPASPDGFEEWVKRADEAWKKCGSMADHQLEV
ncbi:MAG: hypothetical protein LBH66_01445 [Oscillospiraceae bacterium]|jgi:electron-transferring-flavoprotein dehydrogenase|nr:hypothetical protein [Oscillospiraceae bacterium]